MSDTEKAIPPWERPWACFGHCDPEGWFEPCRSRVEMPKQIRGVLAWRRRYAKDALTPEAWDWWLAAHDAEVRAAALEEAEKAKADAWDEAVSAVAWAMRNGPFPLTYTTQNNPYRRSTGTEGDTE